MRKQRFCKPVDWKKSSRPNIGPGSSAFLGLLDAGDGLVNLSASVIAEADASTVNKRLHPCCCWATAAQLANENVSILR